MSAPVDIGPLEMLLPRVGAAVARHHRRLAARHGLTPTAAAVLAALDPVTHRRNAISPRVSGSAPPRSPRCWTGSRRPRRSAASATPSTGASCACTGLRRARRLAGAATSGRGLPRPAPEIEADVRTWLLAVLAVVETDD